MPIRSDAIIGWRSTALHREAQPSQPLGHFRSSVCSWAECHERPDRPAFRNPVAHDTRLYQLTDGVGILKRHHVVRPVDGGDLRMGEALPGAVALGRFGEFADYVSEIVMWPSPIGADDRTCRPVDRGHITDWRRRDCLRHLWTERRLSGSLFFRPNRAKLQLESGQCPCG